VKHRQSERVQGDHCGRHDTGVQARNTINVAMEDLTEEDKKELEEEMAERRSKKLVCFQKTCHGVRPTRQLRPGLR
jgi:hypothetical protein